jgi:hypothetical protein
MFDVPLIGTGLEHLYVTLNPSPDLTEIQLREILYDHLVTRRAAPVDYDALSPEAELELAKCNERCMGKTLGVGRVDTLTGLWKPSLPNSPMIAITGRARGTGAVFAASGVTGKMCGQAMKGALR